MEDISLPKNLKKESDIKMSVSAVCEKDGEKVAYVMFSDDKRTLEGIIPDCKVIRNNGFLQDEVKQIEDYMIANLMELKKMAAGINVLGAFIGK